MNKITGTESDGTPFLALVLEPGNLHRLKHDQPISICVEDMFPDGIPNRLTLVVGYSETPVADARELREHVKVTLDDRTAALKAVKPHCPKCESTIGQFGLARNDTPIAFVYCPNCGCVLGTLPSEDVKGIVS